MKKILIIFVFLCFGLAFAQIAEDPQFEFSSTSSYKYTEQINYQQQHTIPISELQEPFYNSNTQNRNVRKAPGYPPSDPGWEDVPLDESVLPLLIMSVTYCLYKLFKHQII